MHLKLFLLQRQHEGRIAFPIIKIFQSMASVCQKNFCITSLQLWQFVKKGKLLCGATEVVTLEWMLASTSLLV